MAQILQGRAGELFYASAADVRVALASTDVPPHAQLFAELAAEEAERAARSSGWSDRDIDADLPLPVDCLGEWAQSSTASDRLRAVQMHQLARFALVRILRRDDGAHAVDTALQYGEKPCRHHGAGEDAVTVIPLEPLMQVLERLTEPEDYLSLNATMRTRLGAARRETGRALAAFLGLPQTLSATVAGAVPFNRIDRLLYRVVSSQLTVSEMNAVDEMAAKLRPEISLDQFERRIREFIRDSFDPAVRSTESIHRDRGLRLVPEPDGSGTLVIHGPILPLKLSYERVRATARAMRRQELAGLNIDTGDMNQGDADGALQALDDRTIEQYMFDLAVGAVPQTDVRVVRVAPGETREADGRDEATSENPVAEDVEQESFMATVACPTDGAWLRKQAAVTVTMSLSTLMGLGNESATLDHSTPLPAEQARQVAAKATVWHRILYDPATGTVTDEATRTYAPTVAMRRAVEHKWRSCMAPGMYSVLDALRDRPLRSVLSRRPGQGWAHSPLQPHTAVRHTPSAEDERCDSPPTREWGRGRVDPAARSGDSHRGTTRRASRSTQHRRGRSLRDLSAVCRLLRNRDRRVAARNTASHGSVRRHAHHRGDASDR